MVEADHMTPDEVIEWLMVLEAERSGDPRGEKFRATIQTVMAMRNALKRIANGDGVYGAQAGEYKAIARSSLSPKEGKT